MNLSDPTLWFTEISKISTESLSLAYSLLQFHERDHRYIKFSEKLTFLTP